MAEEHDTVRGLVLAGGGAKGSYQVGVYQALMKLGWLPDVITGASVGSLNAALFVMGKVNEAADLWRSLDNHGVLELPEGKTPEELRDFLLETLRGGGLNTEPLGQTIDQYMDENAIRASHIKYGLVITEMNTLRSVQCTLDDIPQGQLKDYMLASSACFPALRAREIDGVKFLDGGYSDNMPTGLAKRMGADELVCVDLEGVGITRPNLTGLPTVMVRSYWELGDILHFDPDTARRNIELGYYDTRRAMGYLRGCAYAVSCDAQSCADAAAFHAKFERVQKAVREKYPVTLTADAALLLAKMKDADLAPLEAAAEDAGVDPAHYYTTHTLCDAFLAKCDQARMQSFAPLFEGSADAARAALAALLPNTFLQALVWRTLTTPEAELLPEVTEHESV
mgnify:CR=1 FL=1